VSDTWKRNLEETKMKQRTDEGIERRDVKKSNKFSATEKRGNLQRKPAVGV
jgi:hypothetical protein